LYNASTSEKPQRGEDIPQGHGTPLGEIEQGKPFHLFTDFGPTSNIY